MRHIGRYPRPRAYIAPLLTATMALVIASFVAAVTVADLRRIEAIYWSELSARGTLLADHLHALLADSLYGRDLDQLDAVATAVSQQPDVAFVYVFTAEGVVLVDTRVAAFPPLGEAVGLLGRRALDDGQHHVDHQSDVLEVVRPIAVNRQVLGGLGVGLRGDALPGQLQAVLVAHLGQGLLLIGLGVGLSYLVARQVTHPIRALTAATEQMAAGHLETRVRGVRAGELGRLAASFNRMAEELEGTVGQLQASRSRIVQAQEGVRRDIAFHLHGRVQGRLLVINSRLLAMQQRAGLPDEAARELGQLIDRLSELIDEDVSALSRRLYPAILRRGLVPALQSLCDQFEASLALDVDLDPALVAREKIDRDLLPEPTRLAAYRIVEEALGNAVKHARATRAAVRLSQLPGQAVRLVVEDDGRGFEVAAGGNGLGLTAMQDAAGAVGGACSIDSAAGHGTVVTATLPTGHGARISAPLGSA
jgi:signal transduction histidine kinase